MCKLCFWEGEGVLNQNLGIRNLWLLLDTFFTHVINPSTSFYFFSSFVCPVGSSCQVLRALPAEPQLLAAFVSLLVEAGQHSHRDVLCKGGLKAVLWEAPSQNNPEYDHEGLGTPKIWFPRLQCSGNSTCLFCLSGVREEIIPPTVVILQDSLEQCWGRCFLADSLVTEWVVSATSSKAEELQQLSCCCGTSWSWATATGIAGGIGGNKEQEFGIWEGKLPPPALECLLATSVGQGRDGFAPAKGHLENFNPELCEL